MGSKCNNCFKITLLERYYTLVHSSGAVGVSFRLGFHDSDVLNSRTVLLSEKYTEILEKKAVQTPTACTIDES